MKIGKRLSIEEMKNVQVGDKFFLAEESIGYTADVLYSEVEVTGIYDRRNNYDVRFNYKSPYETCSRVASDEDVRGGNCQMYHIEEEEAKVEFENKPEWKDAPDWANYLAMDANGDWVWYSTKPRTGAGGYPQWVMDEDEPGEWRFIRINPCLDSALTLEGWETTREGRPESIDCLPVKAAEEEDVVNHPKHYTKHASGIECIQITEHMGFNLGNAIKYLWRADEKGAPVEDLEKAAWYIAREIAKRKVVQP